jgi:hypothetical protein
VTTVNGVDAEDPSVQTVTATPNPVSGAFADLAITNVVAPSSVYQGQTIAITWSVRNAGTGSTSTRSGVAVNAWTDRVVLSPDPVSATKMTWSWPTRLVPSALGSGSSYAGSATVQVPTNLFGIYHLFVLANASGQVYEHLDRAENLGTTAQPMIIGAAAPPVIARQPLDRSVFLGSNATFDALVEGTLAVHLPMAAWHHRSG